MEIVIGIVGLLIGAAIMWYFTIRSANSRYKGIVSDVAGDCDVILVPDIEAGNMFYKALSFLGGAKVAAVIMGATVPIVLTSRSDSEESKMLSIALAAAME